MYKLPTYVELIRVVTVSARLLEQSGEIEDTCLKLDSRTENLPRCESHTRHHHWKAHLEIDTKLENSSLIWALVHEDDPIPALSDL